MIARAKLLGSMPGAIWSCYPIGRPVTIMLMVYLYIDDLRRFIGTKNTQEGITQVLELFQYPKLNKRILYILFEGLLEAIFAQNRVADVLKKMH